MNARSTVVFFLLFLNSAIHSYGQQDSIQNLYFVKKGETALFAENDYQPGKNAFYVYRNCIYNLVMKNKKEITIKVVDIRNDSIYYVTWVSQRPPEYVNRPADTLALHPSQLKKVRMIGDRILGLMSGHSLLDDDHVFQLSDSAKAFPKIVKTQLAPDSSYSITYELVPYLTAQGINRVYERSGRAYYYEGGPIPQARKDSVKKKTELETRKGVWFTPSNANNINGLNLALETMSLDNGPLTIKGVNISAGALSMFLSVYSMMAIGQGNALINMADTVDKSKMETSVRGFSVSAGGIFGETELKGVSINGGMCGVTSVKGLLITGLQNLTEEFYGVEITAIRNRSIKGGGLQVGLFNICKHLKGVQIGLWNVNSKRKLPLINWSF